MAILTAEDFPSVRRAIDVTLDDGIVVDDERMLPDSVLSDQGYLGAAESEVLGKLPNNTFPGTLTTDQQAKVKRATIYYLAARVYPSIPAVIMEAFGDHRYRREYESVEDVVNRLREQGDAEIDAIRDELSIAVTTNTKRFRRATATRGRVLVPPT